MRNKRLLIMALLVLLLAGLGLYYYQYQDSKKVKVQEFAGRIESIDGNTIVVEGGYVSEDPRARLDARMTNIQVDENTVFTSVMVEIPSEQELAATGGFFDGRTLPRIQAASSFEEFKQISNDYTTFVAPSVYAKARQNIFQKDSFTATEIKYEYGRQKQ